MSWPAIAFAPSDPATAYAGTAAFLSAGTYDDRMPAGGTYASRDGGTTWTPANDTPSQDAHLTGLAVDPHNPQVAYAATGNHRLLKSTGAGLNCTAINQGLPESPMALPVAPHPTDPQPPNAGLDRTGLYRSTDGGATWRPSAAGMNPEASVSDAEFDPTAPQVMYAAGRFSGVYRSSAGGATWTPINVGLRTRAVNALAIPADGQHLHAATEGQGVFHLDLSDEPPQPVPTPTPVPPTSTPTPEPTLAPTPVLPTSTPTAVVTAPAATPQIAAFPPKPTSEPQAKRGIRGGGNGALPLALGDPGSVPQ
jgi:hypothetical protein